MTARIVKIVVELTVEVEAESDELAFMDIFDTLDERRAVDPLGGTDFQTRSGKDAVTKSCVAEDMSFQTYDSSWTLWGSIPMGAKYKERSDDR